MVVPLVVQDKTDNVGRNISDEAVGPVIITTWIGATVSPNGRVIEAIGHNRVKGRWCIFVLNDGLLEASKPTSLRDHIQAL